MSGVAQAAGAPSIAALFADAVRHHRAGRLEAAEQLYRQILGLDPRHSDSLHLIGLINASVGRLDIAAAFIAHAIANNGRVAAYHGNLGNVLRSAGRLAEAEASCRRAIALQPDFRDAVFNLAAVLAQLGRDDEALVEFRRSSELKSDDVLTHYNIGAILAKRRDFAGAAESFGRAATLNPTFLEAHNNLGSALRELRHLEAAASSYRAALALKPDFPDAVLNLGLVLSELERWPEAIDTCRRAVALLPEHAEAHIILGNALRGDGQLEAAIACFERALALRPGDALATNSLGAARREQGQFDDAIGFYRTALAASPDDAEARHNLAMALLARGDMAEGWADYEARWGTRQLGGSRPALSAPLWRGEGAVGQTLLIHAEQGLGDTIQFCRYAPLAAARGLRVVVQAPAPLVRLLGSLRWVEHVLPPEARLLEMDWQCPMLSLPLAFGTTLETVPSSTPYLRADATQTVYWAARLRALAGHGPRVGLCWAGNPTQRADKRRSVPLELLAPLLDNAGLRFFSLQKSGAPAEMPHLTDVMAEMQDFADTAALIANLDLVISVDTSVAHLAGALGKPVWLLDRFDHCWRWLQARTDSPWYPTMRIYRQPEAGDWDSVVAAVAQDLFEFGRQTRFAPMREHAL